MDPTPLPDDLPPEEAQPPLPFAWVTWIIVATTVGVFVLQLIELRRYHEDIVGNALAFSGQAFAHGRYYILLSYAWAHAVDLGGGYARYFYWLHIAANMIPLICLGPALEDLLGRARFLGLYLGGAIGSVLFWYYFNSDAQEPIIGASGAVFAIIAGIGVAAPRARVIVLLLYLLPVPMSMLAVSLLICGIEAALIVFQYIPFLEPYSMPDVAHSAHLGGAIFGAIYTWLMLPKRQDELFAR